MTTVVDTDEYRRRLIDPDTYAVLDDCPGVYTFTDHHCNMASGMIEEPLVAHNKTGMLLLGSLYPRIVDGFLSRVPLPNT